MQPAQNAVVESVLRLETQPPGRRGAVRVLVATVATVVLGYPVVRMLHDLDLLAGPPALVAFLLPLPVIVLSTPVQYAIGGGRLDNRPALRIALGVGAMAALLWTIGWPGVVSVSAALVGVIHVHRSGSHVWPFAALVVIGTTAVGEVGAVIGAVPIVMGQGDNLIMTMWAVVMSVLIVTSVGIAVARRERSEEALARTEAHLRTLVASSPDVIDVLDDDDRVLFTSPAVRALGYEVDDVIGHSIFEYVDPSVRERVAEALSRVRAAGAGARDTLDVRVRLADGTTRWFEWRLHNLRDDPLIGGLVVQQRDVTEHLAHRAVLEHAATHDALTGLVNHAELMRRLTAAIPACRPGAAVALLFMDLDGFKAINDTLGHTAGDDVLMTVARRLRQGTRRHDVLGRFGGDEFCAVLTEVRDAAEVRAVVDRIHSELAEPIRLTGRASGEQQVVQVTASIGTAFTTDPRADPHVLVAEADGTMYETKRARSEPDPPGAGVASAPDRRSGAGQVMSPPPPT